MGPSWSHLGPSWNHLGPVQGYEKNKKTKHGQKYRCQANFLKFARRLGESTIFGLLRVILGHLGGHLEAILDHLGPSWGHFGEPWGHLAVILGQRGTILSQLRPSWTILVHLGAILGPSWGHLGAILGPSWGHLGAILSHFKPRENKESPR